MEGGEDLERWCARRLPRHRRRPLADRRAPAVAHDGKETYFFAWVKGQLQDDRLNVADQAIGLRGMDGKTLAVRFADRTAATDPNAEALRPNFVNGPKGEILLLYERHQAGTDRQLVGRRLLLAQ